MAKPPPNTPADQVAPTFGVGTLTRHLLLCIGPDCCDPTLGEQTWDYLKRRMKDLDLVPPKGTTYRTKCGCLRICTQGPIAVVYPDGTWYRHVTPANAERILTEHLLAGRVVEDLCFARNPLPTPPAD